jgi:hypothetical protein
VNPSIFLLLLVAAAIALPVTQFAKKKLRLVNDLLCLALALLVSTALTAVALRLAHSPVVFGWPLVSATAIVFTLAHVAFKALRPSLLRDRFINRRG